jgi:hypothetical protein
LLYVTTRVKHKPFSKILTGKQIVEQSKIPEAARIGKKMASGAVTRIFYIDQAMEVRKETSRSNKGIKRLEEFYVIVSHCAAEY